jgi:hypothetical protein
VSVGILNGAVKPTMKVWIGAGIPVIAMGLFSPSFVWRIQGPTIWQVL